jgi:hypothetical protein
MNQSQSNTSKCISNSPIIKLKKSSGMKNILLLLFALFTSLTVSAQSNKKDPMQSFDQYWAFGVRYGIAQFQGDVNDKSFFAKLKKESKPSFSISLGRQISPVLSIKAAFSNANYFGKNKLVWQGTSLDLSVTGANTEMGVYGTLNLNKLIFKNKETGDSWNAYVSSGVGFANWRCKLKDEDNNVIIDSLGYSASGKTTRKSALSVPIIFGANIQLIEGIWFSLEHAIHFVNSDRMDAYLAGYNDKYSTTTFGITINLQKLSSLGIKRNVEKSTSYSAYQPKPVNTVGSQRVSVMKGRAKSVPELQEYTGYNALLPPPTPKIDTTGRANALRANANKNVWVAEADSGRVEITGGKRLSNVFTGKDSQVMDKLQTGLVPTYRVQIQASKTYIPVEAVSKKLAINEKIAVELRPDGWYRYYIGQYTSLPEARTKLSEMLGKGIKDAFIVSFKTNNRQVIKR